MGDEPCLLWQRREEHSNHGAPPLAGAEIQVVAPT